MKIVSPERLLLAGDIPALIWRAPDAGRRPVIISVHGGAGSKLDILPEDAEYVTSEGVTLVSIDAHLHGERKPLGFELGAPGFIDPRVWLDIISTSAHDIGRAVEDLSKDQSVDASQIALRGGSMGGYIVLAAVGMGVPAAAVVSICGSANYTEVFIEQFAQLDPDLVKRAEVLEPVVRTIDPIFHLENFPPRPILLVHGLFDPLVPISGQRALYEKLAPYYAEHPADCLFLTHAGGHGTPRSLEEFAWTWLVRSIS